MTINKNDNDFRIIISSFQFHFSINVSVDKKVTDHNTKLVTKQSVDKNYPILSYSQLLGDLNGEIEIMYDDKIKENEFKINLYSL